MSSSSFEDKPINNTEKQYMSADAAISRLPNIEVFFPKEQYPTAQERIQQKGNLHYVLEPVTELVEREYIVPGHIDLMVPESQYWYRNNELKKNPKNQHKIDGLPIFLTPNGPLGLGIFPREERLETHGYRFHFYVEQDYINYVTETLFKYYQGNKIYTPLQYIIENDSEDNFYIHRFINLASQYQIIFHEMKDRVPLFARKINSPKKRISHVHASDIHTANLDPIPNNEEFSINDFPITNNDPQDKKEALSSFVQTAVKLLNIKSCTLMYNNETIYNEGSSSQKAKRILGPFQLWFENDESFVGIDLLLGLIKARMQYSFELKSLHIINYNDWSYADSSNKLIKDTQFELLKTIPLTRTFGLENGKKLFIHKLKNGNHHGKGKKIWHICVSGDKLGKVRSEILKTSGGEVNYKKNSGFSIKHINPGGYTYYINATVANDIIH